MSSTYTTHGTKKIFYTWTIEDYELLHDLRKDCGLASPIFPNDGSGLEIYLKLYFDYYLPFIHVHATAKSINRIGRIQFSLGKYPQPCISWTTLPKPGSYSSGASFESTHVKKSASQNGGKIIINCEIAYLTRRTDTSENDSIKVASCKLAEDLGAMLNTKEWADCEIVTSNGQKIPVHKNILSARSKVFAAMFKHRMQENAENCVEIKDFSFDVVSELIRFVYTGEAPNLNLEMSAELLAAADKYGLDRLKSMCAKLMSDNLSVENALVVLKSADLYNLPDLKIKAMQFIQTNIEKESGGSKYDDLLKVLMEKKLQELKLKDSAIEQPKK